MYSSWFSILGNLDSFTLVWSNCSSYKTVSEGLPKMNRQNRGQTDYNVHESNDGSSSPNKMRRKPRKHDHDTQGSILDQGELESSLNYNSRGIQGTKGTYQGHQVDPQQHPRRGKSLKRGRQKSWHRKLRNSTARETTNDDQESGILWMLPMNVVL